MICGCGIRRQLRSHAEIDASPAYRLVGYSALGTRLTVSLSAGSQEVGKLSLSATKLCVPKQRPPYQVTMMQGVNLASCVDSKQVIPVSITSSLSSAGVQACSHGYSHRCVPTACSACHMILVNCRTLEVPCAAAGQRLQRSLSGQDCLWHLRVGGLSIGKTSCILDVLRPSVIINNA